MAEDCEAYLAIDIARAASVLSEKLDLFDKNDIDDHYLPRNVDILSYIFYLKSNASYHIKFQDLYTTVANRVVGIWQKTLIPVISQETKCSKHINKKIDKVLKDYKRLKRNIRSTKASANDINFFLMKIFNITHCKCDNFEYCECSFKNSMSEFQYIFLLDQAKERKFKIDTYYRNFDTSDIESGIANLSTESPTPLTLPDNANTLTLMTTRDSPVNTTNFNNQSRDSTSVSGNSSDHDDPDYKPEPILTIPHVRHLPCSITNLITDGVLIESMRFNASFQLTAAIMNRTLEGLGLITTENKGFVVSASFLKKRSKTLQSTISETWKKKSLETELQCFFFDGVSMQNTMPVLKNDKIVPDNSIMYDNIVIVKQPDNHYLGFVATAQSDAQTIFMKLTEFFQDNEIDLSCLFAIGSDGASTNVGSDNGVIRKFEKALQRPLHRIICLLHLLELILKAVICYFYGENIVKYKTVGKINEALNNCHTFNIHNFSRIELANMPLSDRSFDSSILNSDQKYLYNMGKAVSEGHVKESLAARKPGDISGPRWTTLASRFLRLYVSSAQPSHRLTSVVKFIQNVYIQILFGIKCAPNWTNAPTHIYNILAFSQRLSQETFNIVRERIQYNSYFLHTENILLCMICDKDKIIRRAAYNIILSVRQKNNENVTDTQNVRTFKKPQIAIQYEPLGEEDENSNNNKHYVNLIEWNNDETYEPPYTLNLTNNEIRYFMESDEIIDIPCLPCHSQHTEFYVQAVKGVVTKYVGEKTQDVRVKGKLIARKLNKKFNDQTSRKSDYKVIGHDLTDHI